MEKSAFEGFDISVLGLGDVSAPSEPTDAIAAVFDLQGFTNFCKQIEPHLSVPKYLNAFLIWLMKALRDEMREKNLANEVVLWSHLPFFLKYLGDGILALWDCSRTSSITQTNVVYSMHLICEKYGTTFLPTLKKTLVEPPSSLRCGVARGTVFSVGNGEDYVGSCINMAARLQKLPGISFCFNIRGFDWTHKDSSPFFDESIVIRKVAIRGIGDNELVGILGSEAEALSPANRKIFKSLE